MQADRLVYRSILGSRVTKKKNKKRKEEITTHLVHLSYCKQHLVQTGRIDELIEYVSYIIAGIIPERDPVHVRGQGLLQVFNRWTSE